MRNRKVNGLLRPQYNYNVYNTALLWRHLRVFDIWSLALILSLSNSKDNADVSSLCIWHHLVNRCQPCRFDNRWDIVRLYETGPAGTDRAVGLVITNRQIQQILGLWRQLQLVSVNGRPALDWRKLDSTVWWCYLWRETQKKAVRNMVDWSRWRLT